MIRLIAIFALTIAPLSFAGPVVRSVAVRGTSLQVVLRTQVGQPYDARVIDQDVRRLWSTGRFDDIQVHTDEDGTGAAVIFDVVEAPELRLHLVRIEPPSFGLGLTLPESALLSRRRAQEIALEARKQLKAQGYSDARVDYDVIACARNQADLRLKITASDPVRVKRVEFAGDPGLDPRELRGTLRALRIRRVFPGIPGLWNGWRLYPPYSSEAVDADLARLHSLYISNGYLGATLRVDDLAAHGPDASIRIRVQSGPLYRRPDGGWLRPSDSCNTLLAARGEAERQGILDFSVSLRADLTTQIDRGRPYRVGQIHFIGNRHYKEATLRRNFLLDEDQLFDLRLLRKSMARLNRTMLFEPIDERSLEFYRHEESAVADLTVRLIERKRGAWRLSGPVGSARFAGPLEASVGSRLPSWGRGIFELSTYTASISLFAFVHPILPFLPTPLRSGIWPVLALQRPYSPGEGWRSGFTVAPQMGWRAAVLRYPATQLEQRLLPALDRGRGLAPELFVTVERPAGDTARDDMEMLCQSPQPRLAWLSRTASVGIQLLGALQ